MRSKYLSKLAIICASTLFCTTIVLSGCGGEDEMHKAATSLAYSTGINAEGLYDESMFYRNDLNFVKGDFADPGAFYCEADGYYYVYSTDMRCVRTKDFVDFEDLGVVFTAAADAWSNNYYWAPEVIYDNSTQKYYLYYSATAKDVTNTNWNGRHRIGIAVADTPQGPFHEWEGTRSIPLRDEDGKRVQENGEDVFVNEKLTKAQFPIDFMQSPVVHELGLNNFAMIDAHPFFDGDDLYLYFVHHKDDWNETQGIWGVKMIDMVTPDYDTLTQLTEPGKKTIGGEANFEVGVTVNEAPFMLSHVTKKPDGTTVKKYYLTYSIYGYSNPLYSVACAVSDSPLGAFVKLDTKDGQPIVGIDSDFDHMGGTGHHSFVQCGDEYFMMYHAFSNRTNINDGRTLAFDRMTFAYNESLGYDLMYGNGPTYSLQPLPYTVTGYQNLAKDAVITADGIADGSRASYLNDGRFTINYDNDFDFVSASNTVTVTIDFGKEVALNAIMVYNGRDIYQAFSSIDVIRFESAEGNYYIDNLTFPKAYIGDGIMRPGGAAIAEFNTIKANKIVMKITKKIAAELFPDRPDAAGVSISEIVVLGKEANA